MAAEWLVHISLGEASIQELHLELLRRVERNLLDGARVADDLLAHRALWHAALLDTSGLDGDGVAGYPQLIKLRDMRGNFYNVDTLYVLAVNEAAAKRIVEFQEAWLADTADILDLTHTEKALGSYGRDDDWRIVVMWWD